MTLKYGPGALDQLQKLRDDPSLTRLSERIDRVLDIIERRPTSAAARQRQFRVRPPLWGVPVRGRDEDWIVLWEMDGGEPLIHYVGPWR